MSTKKPRLWAPKPHKAVDWNERAVVKRLEKGPLWAGTKLDGFRVLILKLDGGLVCTTREGIELSSLRPLYPALAEVLFPSGMWEDDTVFDGEVYIRGDMPFEEMSGHLRRDTPIEEALRSRVQFCIFDYGHRGGYQGGPGRWDDLTKRKAALSGLHLPLHRLFDEWPGLVVHESMFLCRTLGDIQDRYASARSAGFEGLVLKDPELEQRNGKVSGWWKVKPGCGADFAPGFEADGTVVGYVWGDEEKANAGKIVGFRVRLESGVEVSCTGLTQEQMQEYTEEYLTAQAGCEDPVYHGPHYGRCCRVSAMEMTRDGSLRHPHFDGFRDMDGAEGVKA